MKDIRHKLFTTKASSIDEENKSVTFVISTNEEDRYGEVVDQKSWDFKSYEANPLVLWGHDPSEPENVLGQGSNLQVSKDGNQTTATLTFATDINAKAALVWNLIVRGVLRTVSVGFRNHTFEIEEDTPVLKDNELLEISVVPIPANAGAVALAFKAGEINRKDAKWLMDTMTKELDLMKKQYEASKPVKKEKSMTDEQATAMIDALAKATEAISTLKETVDAQGQMITELKEVATPPQETDEQKAEREAKEAADKEAAEKAEADKKAADEEAARKAAEEEAKKDPAKSGDDDQGGAEGTDDELDDDAELTPELQAQIDAELELATAN